MEKCKNYMTSANEAEEKLKSISTLLADNLESMHEDESVHVVHRYFKSTKSLDFSLHRSSVNVSIYSVPSLKLLNVSQTNISAANIPFGKLSKGFLLNGSVKHYTLIDDIYVTSSWSFLTLDFCKSA